MLAFAFLLVLLALLVDGQQTIYTTENVAVETVYGPPPSAAPIAPAAVDPGTEYPQYYSLPAAQPGLLSLPPANAVPYDAAQTQPVQYAPNPYAASAVAPPPQPQPQPQPAPVVSPSPAYIDTGYASTTQLMAPPSATPYSGSGMDPLDQGIPNANGTTGLTCKMDQGILTIENINYYQGRWWEHLKEQIKGACVRKMDDWNFREPSSPDEGEYATITFKLKDIEPNLPCISNIIQRASGNQLAGPCEMYVSHNWGESDLDVYEPRSVALNRWSDMKDKGFAESNYGLWEIWNISGWTTGDYENGDARAATHQEIFERLHHVMEEAQDFGRIPDDPRHWRQFLDQNERPAIYCGIYSSPEKVTKAISDASGMGSDQFVIESRTHDGKWDDWSKGYAPFKYHETLPQSHQFEGLAYVDLGGEGYNTDGAMCQPADARCPFPIPGTPGYQDPAATVEPPSEEPIYSSTYSAEASQTYALQPPPVQTYASPPPPVQTYAPQPTPAVNYGQPQPVQAQAYPPQQPPAQGIPAQPAPQVNYVPPQPNYAQPPAQAQPVYYDANGYPVGTYASPAPVAQAA